MRIGLIGFKETFQTEIVLKCMSTLSHVAPSTKWRFGQVHIDLNERDLAEEIARRTSTVSNSGDSLLSLSATPQGIVNNFLVQFEIYSKRTCSAVRIRLEIDGALPDRVRRCRRLMEGLIPVWNPDSAYVTDFERMRQDCVQFSSVFPSGYVIYRKQPLRLQLDSGDSETFETEDCQTGICVRFREQFLAISHPSCEQFNRLIELSGGVDDRFSVL